MAASVASPSGPRIKITHFKLGSDSTTPATEEQEDLVGSTVYTGQASHFSIFDAQTVQVILEVPASAGPFSYGEIGLYLEDGTMFARFSYGELKTKTSTSVTGYAEIRRIHALMRIAQNPAVFEFYTADPPLVTEYPNLSYVVAPSIIASTPLVIVHQPTPYNDSILLHSHTDSLWTIDDYVFVGNATLTAVDESYLEATLFADLGDTDVDGKYLVQTPTGQIRSVTSIEDDRANFATDLAPIPTVSSIVHVYEAIESVAQRVSALDSDLRQLALRDVGMIRIRPYSTLEATEIECNGALIDRTFYSSLFGKIGTLYGVGNGTTTFQIPDCRGLVVRGWDHGRGLDPSRSLGNYQADAFPAHTHSTNFGGSGVIADGNFASPGGGIADRTAGATNSSGSGSETRMKNISFMYTIVALTGYEDGSPPPPEAVLTLSPNPASLSYVVGDTVTNQTLASYAPIGDATLTLVSGSVPPGLTVTDNGSSVIRANGSPTNPGSYSAVFNVVNGIYSSSFTYNATVTADPPPPPPSGPPPVVNITSLANASARSPYGATLVSYGMTAAGAVVLYRPNQSLVPIYTYPAGEWFTSGDISLVEVKVEVTGGSLYVTSSPTGTWLPMSSDRNWDMRSGLGGSGEEVLYLEVSLRNSETLSVLDTATIEMRIGEGGGEGG